MSAPAKRQDQRESAPGYAARKAAVAILSDVLRMKRPLDAGRVRCARRGGFAAARCRLRPRDRHHEPAPVRSIGSADPSIRAEIPAAAQSRADAGDPSGGRLRAPVPRRCAPCGGGRRQSAGAIRCEGGAFQGPDQRGAPPRREGRRERACRSGCGGAQHARLAVAALDRALWRGDGAGHRPGAPSRSPARPHAEIA